eukprot:Amastigsp_a509313_87.p2 type:complete len:190 gc:universal Amastigsp_a509313_87:1037-468(-)
MPARRKGREHIRRNRLVRDRCDVPQHEVHDAHGRSRVPDDLVDRDVLLLLICPRRDRYDECKVEEQRADQLAQIRAHKRDALGLEVVHEVLHEELGREDDARPEAHVLGVDALVQVQKPDRHAHGDDDHVPERDHQPVALERRDKVLRALERHVVDAETERRPEDADQELVHDLCCDDDRRDVERRQRH